MNYKKISFVVLFIILTNTSIAQKVNIGVGADITISTKYLAPSIFGPHLFLEIKPFEKISFRTNAGINYHSIGSRKEIATIGSIFFTQIEETIQYGFTSEKSGQLFVGCGLGYYSIVNNDASDHPGYIGDVEVIGQGLQTSYGFHLVGGKRLLDKNLVFQLKYVYLPVTLTSNLDDKNSVMHIFSIGLSYVFNL